MEINWHICWFRFDIAGGIVHNVIIEERNTVYIIRVRILSYPFSDGHHFRSFYSRTEVGKCQAQTKKVLGNLLVTCRFVWVQSWSMRPYSTLFYPSRVFFTLKLTIADVFLWIFSIASIHCDMPSMTRWCNLTIPSHCSICALIFTSPRSHITKTRFYKSLSVNVFFDFDCYHAMVSDFDPIIFRSYNGSSQPAPEVAPDEIEVNISAIMIIHFFF